MPKAKPMFDAAGKQGEEHEEKNGGGKGGCLLQRGASALARQKNAWAAKKGVQFPEATRKNSGWAGACLKKFSRSQKKSLVPPHEITNRHCCRQMRAQRRSEVTEEVRNWKKRKGAGGFHSHGPQKKPKIGRASKKRLARSRGGGEGAGAAPQDHVSATQSDFHKEEKRGESIS